ncbi:MAG: HD domain-containing protein [Ignavibacteriales bacterium]|nr:MAG: HD domain-containing protein [Ignavibacteriales bacterium]
MTISINIKEEFHKRRDHLFQNILKNKDNLKFSMEYSLLVEEFIHAVVPNKQYNFSLASAGSFSRRELSPYSDIDLMFITETVEGNESDISEIITKLWDYGIEVSHTVRDYSDLAKYLEEDLHTFTQFIETRFLIGSEKIYKQWNDFLIALITDEIKADLLQKLFEDTEKRYEKYGSSPKMLEPNVKLSAGGLRDFQAVEWMYILKDKILLNKQNESTQAEIFIDQLRKNGYASAKECENLLTSYDFIISIRNLIHILSHQKNDRLEFIAQTKISELNSIYGNSISVLMQKYFAAATAINRFSKSISKKFREEFLNPLPDSLSIELDEDFCVKGKSLYFIGKGALSLSAVLRSFYYRGLYNSHFDDALRSMIIESAEKYRNEKNPEAESSVFFREILKLPRNVGNTLQSMNELGVLSAFMPEFKDLVGYLQHGVYHCFTADEHTLVTIQNVEKLEKDTSTLGKIYNSLKDREILFLALLFHDIAKPINLAGHEIIGSEMASSIMHRLGYSEEEIDSVTFLVRNHLMMEQIAFRRNLSDPETLNNFTAKFTSVQNLNYLYLVTYADLSAVNPAVWTSWKSELLSELYLKSKAMLEDQLTGEELLIKTTYVVPKDITKHSQLISEDHVQEHIDSINDMAYAHHFSEEEIAKHIEEIQKGIKISVLFKDLPNFTNITVITKDFPSLLSRLCGVFSINDANIHDAKIFTRKDGIVIDTFNVTDFRTHKKIEPERYGKIENDLSAVISGLLQLNQEFAKMKSRWWRIENKFFKRTGKVKITFEDHEKYTIIDVVSPDRLGFLYQVTKKMNELGLIIYFAKISTRGDDIVDSFYVLDRNGKKVSQNDYELIVTELTATINQLL